MKVLFIGGTGIISTAVSKLAVERGIELYMLNRGMRSEFIPKKAKLIKGDIREPPAADLLQPYAFDVVVDWIGFVPEHVETDIALFRGKVGQ